MTPFPERLKIIGLLNEAIAQGARKDQACKVIGISIRTIQRWYEDNHTIRPDLRPVASKSAPKNKLTEAERLEILSACNAPEFADYPPGFIVPTLADRGIYIGSESTFYRVLHAHQQVKQRSHKRTVRFQKPAPVVAHQPNEVWTWDITYLPSTVKGQHFYLYMITDIYSRKIVGAEVYKEERGELAALLLQRSIWREKCVGNKLLLHSDNGSPMRSFTMKAKMDDLGVTSSYSRPRMSNDNPYSEALFRTLKYRHSGASNGFANLEVSRIWVSEFIDWYNNHHKHSAIKYVSPCERHQGRDKEILQHRQRVYEIARSRSPERWSGSTRDWGYITEVFLNPDKTTKEEKMRQLA